MLYESFVVFMRVYIIGAIIVGSLCTALAFTSGDEQTTRGKLAASLVGFVFWPVVVWVFTREVVFVGPENRDGR